MEVKKKHIDLNNSKLYKKALRLDAKLKKGQPITQRDLDDLLEDLVMLLTVHACFVEVVKRVCEKYKNMEDLEGIMTKMKSIAEYYDK